MVVQTRDTAKNRNRLTCSHIRHLEVLSSVLGSARLCGKQRLCKRDLQDLRRHWCQECVIVQVGNLRIGSMSRKAVCALALACSLAVPALTVYGKKSKTTTPEPPAIPQMTEDQKVLYALNRLAYGPRPAEVEAVKEVRARQMDRGPASSRKHAREPRAGRQTTAARYPGAARRRRDQSYPPPS